MVLQNVFRYRISSMNPYFVEYDFYYTVFVKLYNIIIFFLINTDYDVPIVLIEYYIIINIMFENNVFNT